MESQDANPKLELSNRVAKIPVAVSLLEQMLPIGTTVLGVEFHQEYGVINLIVSHPTFDALDTGDMIPTRSLLIRRGTHVEKVEYAS